MSIAVDRIQNYYQYSDAEAKFYQLLNPEVQDVEEEKIEEKSRPKESNQDVKAKKVKKNKKKESSENVQKSEESVKQLQSEITIKPKKIVVKESSKEEESLKDDSGIAESPTEPTASTATKKKSRSKRQREKKAAEKAAAAIALQQTEVPPKIDISPKPEQAISKTVQESPKPKDTTAANKKKKSNKNASSDQKPVKDESKNGVSCTATATSTLATEIAKARQHIKSSLERVDGVSNFNIPGSELLERISVLEKDNASLRGLVDGMQKLVISLESRLNKLEGSPTSAPTQQKSAPVPAAKKDDDDEDDDVDLFGSDEEEDAEAEKLKEERLKAYAEKKSKKPVLIAKSSILLDVKPWSDETDMKAMEANVRTIEMDGLLWGASKLIPLAYGIKKLQIMCVIEDDKVSVDELTEKIEAFEDVVQSVDIAAFNKI